MFKYGRMQKKVLSQLVCGSCGMCQDSTLLGVQVTTRLGLFLHSSHLVYSEDSGDSDYALQASAFFAGAQWDSVIDSVIQRERKREKPSLQVQKVVAKNMQTLGMMKRSFKCLSKDSFSKPTSDHTLNTVHQLGHHICQKTLMLQSGYNIMLQSQSRICQSYPMKTD